MKSPCIVIVAALSVLLSSSCRRDRSVAPIAPQQIDGREQFVGIYDVTDSLGNWLYEMEIRKHENMDSLVFRGWSDHFDLSVRREHSDPTNALNFGHYFGVTDDSGNRWALYRDYDEAFGTNIILGDTLHMSYLKDNIAFYVEDGVPYFSQSYREYAVKRDWE